MILPLLLSASSLAAPQFECVASFRTLDKNHKSIEERVPMAVAFDNATLTKYEAELRGKFFMLLDESGRLLASITAAPEYTKGSVVRGKAGDDGAFRLSEVDGPTVHQIECLRQKGK